MSDRCSPKTPMGFEAIVQRNTLAEFSSNRRNCQDVADVRWLLEKYSALSARMKVAEHYIKELESLPNTSTTAHKEQVSALNKRINDITARSENTFSAILRAEDVSGALEDERDSFRVTVANLQAENEWLTSNLLRAGCVVQHDGSFFLDDVPKMLAREFDLLKEENERLRCELDDLKSENAANGHIVNDVMSAIEADDCADLGYDIEQIYSERNALRQVCAEAARKISEDVRDDGPCGREALIDVYIMLNEAANCGGEE